MPRWVKKLKNKFSDLLGHIHGRIRVLKAFFLLSRLERNPPDEKSDLFDRVNDPIARASMYKDELEDFQLRIIRIRMWVHEGKKGPVRSRFKILTEEDMAKQREALRNYDF